MNRSKFICFVGLLVVTTCSFSMEISALENGSEKVNRTILNSTILNNISSSNSSGNNFSADALDTNSTNLTSPDVSEPRSNVSVNASSGPSHPVFGAFLATAFSLGTGMKDNSSAYKLGGKNKTVKDLSRMWYVIQGTPHGYV